MTATLSPADLSGISVIVAEADPFDTDDERAAPIAISIDDDTPDEWRGMTARLTPAAAREFAAQILAAARTAELQAASDTSHASYTAPTEPHRDR